MQENAVHIRRYHVGVNDADFARQLKLSALFNYCQESATTGAEALGIGMSFMEAELCHYPLARMSQLVG